MSHVVGVLRMAGVTLRSSGALVALFVLSGIMALVLVGCSGGDGPRLPCPDRPGNGGPPDGGPDGDELTTEETVAAVEDYGAQYAQMLSEGMTIPEAMEQLAQRMRQSGHFSAVEVDATGQIVWAEFTSGWPYAVLGNRTADSDEVANERAQAQVEAAGEIQAADAVELPASTRAVLMNGFGQWRPEVAVSLNDVDAMLSNRGYRVSQQRVTVPNLQSLGSPGVVYINSHGASPEEASAVGRPVLWLDEPLTQPASDAYRALGWKDNDYITMLSTSEDDPSTGESVSVNHFGVTDVFIRNEVGLGTNSVVFSQSCTSGAAQMVEAFLAAGAGVYAGWDDWCAGSAAPEYFFDRMSAANAYRPEDPPQRPFDWQFVYTDMQQHDLHKITVDYGFFGGLAGQIGVRTATLFFHSNDDTGVVAPTISYMEMQEPDSRLVMNGVFGSRQDEVTVGRTPVAIVSWSPREIVCELPLEGPGAAGPVQVTVDGRESNRVNLTEWRGDFEYRWRPGVGSLGVDFDMELHWRADVHDYRREPGATPEPNDPVFFAAAPDTRGTWRAFGDYENVLSDGTVRRVVWLGSGTLEFYHSDEAEQLRNMTQPSAAVEVAGMMGQSIETSQFTQFPLPTIGDREGISAFGLIRPENQRIQLGLLARAEITVEAYEDGVLEHRATTPVEVPVMAMNDGFFPNQLGFIQLPLDDSFHVDAGNKTLSAGDVTFSLRWGTITSVFGPNPSHEQ